MCRPWCRQACVTSVSEFSLTLLPKCFLLKEQKGNQPEKKDPHQLPGPFLSTLQYVLRLSASLRKEELSLFYGEPPGQKA